jgi:hypothetical protein
VNCWELKIQTKSKKKYNEVEKGRRAEANYVYCDEIENNNLTFCAGERARRSVHGAEANEDCLNAL